MATKARITSDDLWRMADGDVRRELVDGQIIEMGPAGVVHGEVMARISRSLVEHAEKHRAGKILAGDVGFVLNLPDDPDRVRAPYLAFICAQRLFG